MFSGRIIRGEQIAQQLGYPTANLDLQPKDTKLREGVYAAWGHLRGKKYPAALVIQNEIQKVEVHLLSYIGGELYGESLEIEPVQKVSEIERLGKEDLQKKIMEDIQLIKELLEEREKKKIDPKDV